jgi:hypothetical protein
VICKDRLEIYPHAEDFCRLRPFVRDQMLLLFSMILKRAWLELDETEEGRIVLLFQTLISINEAHRLLAIQLIRAVLQEFTTTKASAMGLTFEIHMKSRQSFESRFLGLFLQMTVQSIEEMIQIKEAWYDTLLLDTCLHVLESILDWKFGLTFMEFENFSKMTSSIHETDIRRPPEAWATLLLSGPFSSLVFNLMHKVSRSGPILVCLASFDGPIFQDKKQKLQFAEFILQCIEMTIHQ